MNIGDSVILEKTGSVLDGKIGTIIDFWGTGAFLIQFLNVSPSTAKTYDIAQSWELTLVPTTTCTRENKNDLYAKNVKRKDMPVFSGVLQYFPDAIMMLSHHSKKGNDKHNPGQPLHWAKEKSPDHADCIARHLIDIGPGWDEKDPETGSYHAAALAWRALALLQTLIERKKTEQKDVDSDSSKT